MLFFGKSLDPNKPDFTKQSFKNNRNTKIIEKKEAMETLQQK